MARLQFSQGFKIIQRANTPEPLSVDTRQEFSRLWLYPASGATGGRLVDNGASVYVGKSGIGDPICTDEIAVGGAPTLFELQPGEKVRLCDILVYGAVGDGIFFSYT